MNYSSVSTLAKELSDTIIRPLPVVDIHTHINPFDPATHDVGELIFYHYIVTELEAAGISRSSLAAATTVEQKVDLFVSSAGLVANTITFWCLRHVLAHYGLDNGTELTREGLLQINEKIRGDGSNGSRPRQVLVESNNIRKTALTLNIIEEIPDFDREVFFGTLRLDELLGGTSELNLNQLMAVSGTTIGCLSSFERTVGQRVMEFAERGGKALTAGLSSEEDFVSTNRADTEKLFETVLRGKPLKAKGQLLLHSYLLDFYAGLASDLNLPFQLLLGIQRPLPGDSAVSAVRPDLVTRYTPLFHKFSDAKFDLFLGSAVHSQEAVATAKNYANISLSGFWWHAFSPPYIRAMLTERLLALPVAKLHAFFSDAYNVEWSTGKLALLRHELSWVLAELIVSGYLLESQAPDMARLMLSGNATRLYKL